MTKEEFAILNPDLFPKDLFPKRDACIVSYYKSILPDIQETKNCIKVYGFVEQEVGNYRNGFTEVRKLGHRYTIRHIMNPNHHVSNEEDIEIYIKNFLKLNGYQ